MSVGIGISAIVSVVVGVYLGTQEPSVPDGISELGTEPTPMGLEVLSW